jgi:hypothetical protein
MSSAFSLTPGFSPVIAGKNYQNRFNGFSRRQAVETARPPERLRHPAEAGC